ARALGPGGTDLGAADQDPVAGSVLAVCADVGNDAHAFGLDTEGDDFAGEFVRTGLLEGTDGRHFQISVFRFRARTIAASMAIDGTETIAGASPFAGTGQHRRDCLARARNDAHRGPMEHGVGPSGEESCDDAVAPTRSKRAPRAGLREDQAMEEAAWSGQRYEKNADY